MRDTIEDNRGIGGPGAPPRALSRGLSVAIVKTNLAHELKSSQLSSTNATKGAASYTTSVVAQNDFN